MTDDAQTIVSMIETGFVFVLLGTLVYVLVLAALSRTKGPKIGGG